MFFIGVFIVSWILWIMFADKKRWRELFPAAFFAGFLGLSTEPLMDQYILWAYYTNGIEQGGIIRLLDDLGIYMVVTYLFLQWLPERKSFSKMLKYWLVWTAVAVSIEWLYLQMGYMKHHKWWTLWHSYAADWFLFWLFYHYHKSFTLHFLRKTETKETADQLSKLDNKKDLYYSIIEHSPEAIAIEVDGYLVFVNQACLALFKAENKEEIIGRHVAEFNQPEELNCVSQRMKMVRDTGKISPYHQTVVRLDGEVIEIEITASLFSYQNQNAVQLIMRRSNKGEKRSIG